MSDSKLVVNYFSSGIVVGSLIMLNLIYNVGPTNFVDYGQKKIFILLGIFISSIIFYNEFLKENKNLFVLSIIIIGLIMTVIEIIRVGL